MEINEAQQLVDNWIKTVGNGYFDVLTNMAICCLRARAVKAARSSKFQGCQ